MLLYLEEAREKERKRKRKSDAISVTEDNTTRALLVALSFDNWLYFSLSRAGSGDLLSVSQGVLLIASITLSPLLIATVCALQLTERQRRVYK